MRAPKVGHHDARVLHEDAEQLLQELGLGHGEQLGEDVPVDRPARALHPVGRARRLPPRAVQGRDPAPEDGLELLGAHRLRDVVVHARGQAALAVTLHRARRQRDDRGVARALHGADHARGFEAVGVWHLAVHEDRVVGLLPDRGHRLVPGRGHVHRVTEAFQDARRDLLVHHVVLRYQDPAARGRDGGGRGRGCGRGLRGRRRQFGGGRDLAGGCLGGGGFLRARGQGRTLETRREPEHAALARLAHDAELAAHQLHQPLGDDEAEARAPVPSRRGPVRLREGLEEASQRFGLDADPRISHGEADDLGLRLLGLHADPHRHLTPLRELHGIAHEVDQGLSQPAGISAQDVGDAVLDRRRQVDPLGLGQGREEADHLRHELPRGEVDALQGEMARLDLREIEDVVDDAHERAPGAADGLDVVPLLGRERRVLQQRGHPDHAVHGRADLMAHVGDELALGPAGLGQLQGALAELLVGLRQVLRAPGELLRPFPDAELEMAPEVDHVAMDPAEPIGQRDRHRGKEGGEADGDEAHGGRDPPALDGDVVDVAGRHRDEPDADGARLRMTPPGRPRGLPQEGGGQEERAQLPDGQQAQVQAEAGRQEHGHPADHIQDLEGAQRPRDRAGEERPQELHEQDRDHVEQRVLDLLQPHEVVGEGILPLAAQQGVDAGAGGDEAEPQVFALIGLAPEELQVIEAGGDEEGGEDERGQLADDRVASQLVDGSQAVGAFDGRGHARAGGVGLPRPQREHQAAARLDGRGGNEIGRVPVVIDATRRGQTADATELFAPRKDLVRAVHLADGEAEAEAPAFLLRGAQARGTHLYGQAIPGVGLAFPGMATPAQGHVRPAPGRVVVIGLRPAEVVPRALPPVHGQRDRPLEGRDHEVRVTDADRLGQGGRPWRDQKGEADTGEAGPSQDGLRPGRDRARGARAGGSRGSAGRRDAPPGGCRDRRGCRDRSRHGSADPAPA